MPLLRVAAWCVVGTLVTMAVTPPRIAQGNSHELEAVMRGLGQYLAAGRGASPVIVDVAMCIPANAGRTGDSAGVTRSKSLLRALVSVGGITLADAPSDTMPNLTICIPQISGDSARVTVYSSSPLPNATWAGITFRQHGVSTLVYRLVRRYERWTVEDVREVYHADFSSPLADSLRSQLGWTEPGGGPRPTAPGALHASRPQRLRALGR